MYAYFMNPPKQLVLVVMSIGILLTVISFVPLVGTFRSAEEICASKSRQNMPGGGSDYTYCLQENNLDVISSKRSISRRLNIGRLFLGLALTSASFLIYKHQNY